MNVESQQTEGGRRQVVIGDFPWVPCLRAANAIVRLNAKYRPLMARLAPRCGFYRVRQGGLSAVLPVQWMSPELVLWGPRALISEFSILHRHVHRVSGLIVDVGANTGMFALMAASAYGQEVLAYEPDPLAHEVLRLNCAENSSLAIRPIRMGLGETKKRVAFAAGSNGHIEPGVDPGAPPEIDWEEFRLSGTSSTVIDLTTIDAECGDRDVGLIKVDCEGYEQFVLKGAESTIARCNPVLFIEVHPVFIRNFVPEIHPTWIYDLLGDRYQIRWFVFEARRAGRLERLVDYYRWRGGVRPLRELTPDQAMAEFSAAGPPMQMYALCEPS